MSPKRKGSDLRPLLVSMRPRQWIKNLLVVAVPLASGTFLEQRCRGQDHRRFRIDVPCCVVGVPRQRRTGSRFRPQTPQQVPAAYRLRRTASAHGTDCGRCFSRRRTGRGRGCWRRPTSCGWLPDTSGFGDLCRMGQTPTRVGSGERRRRFCDPSDRRRSRGGFLPRPGSPTVTAATAFFVVSGKRYSELVTQGVSGTVRVSKTIRRDT